MYGSVVQGDLLRSDYKRRNPNDSSQWIRQFRIGNELTETGLDADELIATTNLHLAALRSLGNIAIPEIAQYVTNPGFDGVKEPTLYEMTAHIEGIGLDTIQIDDYSKGLLRGVADTLHGYFDWAQQSRQTFVLADITDVRQYIYGRQGLEPDQNVYLVDTQPYITTNDDGSDFLVFQQGILQEWSDWVATV